jgi:periplasmic protein CpxP/Spy
MASMFKPVPKGQTMKTWLRRTLIGVFGATVLFGGMAACSHRMDGGWQMSEADSAKWRERMLDRVAGQLKLDDAQKAKLATLADTVRAQRQAIAPGGATAMRDEVKSLVAGERFDRSKAQALVEAKTGLLREKSPAVIAAAADFYDSLKPEQQQQVREFMAKRQGRHGWRG